MCWIREYFYLSECNPDYIYVFGHTPLCFINDDGSFIPTKIMYPTSENDEWKQFDELTDEKGNLYVPFGGFLI